ncbi:glutamine-hydrolyzing GMP synthase [Candidatus Nitrosacidococcus tergens]|uniref:GMP synthase [glutamine-hydrolyzing] n=1 Tax=Candidatus Nitrosacidococcus tergens TaxID=553981 RepID=A0A7G1QBF0_9GAMM|nr:glutamine-hydrolyzing GMP synthase [Candidatus Nitrosacidococcus tergens]CAB1277374.1 GMP synthetase (glutamine aminotransferase) [Candidatus Nitrosacidococcus tergens]
MSLSYNHSILILDFGSQYTQLIARRIREIGVYCEIYPYHIKDEILISLTPKGIILSGGPDSVRGEYAPQVSELIFSMGIPILGICYGMQTMAAQLGGKVELATHREYGYAQVCAYPSPLFIEVKDKNTHEEFLLDVWMSHGDRVTKLPAGFTKIASTNNSPIAGMADEKRQFYGLQFHPEVTHTPQGTNILKGFIQNICKCEFQWTPQKIVEDKIIQIKNQVGADKVLLALSGGVDSSVVAALLHQAIGNQLICVFVDNGLLRLGEVEQVMTTFVEHFGIQVILVNAKQRFLEALSGVSDPEEKRKIIGHIFIEIFEEEARKLKNITWLAQGTIYPDVIESAGTKTGKTQTIKSHHNVGGLPEKLNLKLLEPLRELFKDEVRNLGTKLGLPFELVHRHPFPGPGLGVRILGEIKKEYADLLRCADAIFIEELRAHDWYYKTSQAFAVFLPIKSVGVVGDERSYEFVIALRAIESIDFMTAHWVHLPYELLSYISNRIINEIPKISRVVYDISGKPPATIEWE